MEPKTDKFVDTAGQELKNEHSRIFLKLLPVFISAMRDVTMGAFPDPEAAHALGGCIRGEVLSRLPELLEEFEEKALANGAKVFWARDSRAANEYILNLAQEKGVRYVTKGKSMVTEEMGLNDVLEENGIKVFETDLGEFIAQLLKRPPFHIMGPAVNVPVEEIRDLYMEKAGLEEPTTDPIELGFAARLFLRDKFHHMKMGITGINFAVAETGTIINVENEGNIRFNKSSPDVQVSVMTLEKVVPTMGDALHLLRLLCRNCTGQELGAYVTMDSGPKQEDEIDGPEELHVIILDNGRAEFFHDLKAREILRCIRCGGCLNICPIYKKIGGYPYGWVYSGPLGQILNPLLLGLSGTKDLYGACTLCQACKVTCPAGVDHPGIIRYLRAKDVEKDQALGGTGASLDETLLYTGLALAGSHPGLWRLAAGLIRPIVNRASRKGMGGKGAEALSLWLRSRDLPVMPAKSFRDRWTDLKRG